MEWFATPNIQSFRYPDRMNDYLDCRNDCPFLNKNLFGNLARLGLISRSSWQVTM